MKRPLQYSLFVQKSYLSSVQKMQRSPQTCSVATSVDESANCSEQLSLTFQFNKLIFNPLA